MKKNIFFLLMLMQFASTYSQTKAILDDRMECRPFNYVIMINGKLPEYTTTTLKFHNNNNDSVRCKHRYGFIISCTCHLSELCNDLPDTALVFIEYRYKEPIGLWNEYKIHSYKDTLNWGVFKGIDVVCINELNKKRHTYYIYYKLEPPWIRVVKYSPQLHVSKRRFYKKIYNGLFQTGYTIPEKRGGKSRPRYY